MRGGLAPVGAAVMERIFVANDGRGDPVFSIDGWLVGKHLTGDKIAQARADADTIKTIFAATQKGGG